jgi:antitoxin component YwqK of YwqJK toxin-antitoxin module
MRLFVFVFFVSLFFTACDNADLRKEYYASGALKSETEFIDGLKNGSSVMYDSFGNVVSRRNFLKDTLFGQSITYYSDGKISEIVNYDKGILNGEYLRFYPNGNIGGKGEYRNGRNVRFYYQYHPEDSGKILREAYLINVNGEPMRYYIKSIADDGTTEYEYRSVIVDVPKKVSLSDVVNVSLQLNKNNRCSSATVIIGDFDDDFKIISHADTIGFKDGRVSYKFVAKNTGKFLLRGQLICSDTRVYTDSTVTDTSYGYFEEEITVN